MNWQNRKITMVFSLIVTCILMAGTSAQAQWNESQKLIPNTGRVSDVFGTSVDVDGEHAIIGAPSEVEESISGAAFIFQKQNGTWNQVGRLTTQSGAPGDLFGFHVAISGDYAMVAAPDLVDGGILTGAIFVFKRQGTTWVEVQKLSTNAGFIEYGYALSMDGSFAVVGAQRDDGHENESGAAYVYELQGTSWYEVARLVASDGAAHDSFGSSVAINGDHILIGAKENDDDGSRSGSAYIFQRQGSSWVEMQKLIASDAAAADEFGRAVALSSDYALVGAPFDKINGASSGAAYVFEKSGRNWQQSDKLVASDRGEGDWFGVSLAAWNDYLVVGARLDDNNGNSNAGGAYVFDSDGTFWHETQKLIPNDSRESHLFGWSFAVSGDEILSGAIGDDTHGHRSGAAYAFSKSDGSLSVSSFTLIDAQTDQPVAGYDPIPEDALLNLKQLPRYLNIRANASGNTESVRFAFGGKSNFKTENVAPYALFGDSNGNYDAGKLHVGSHTLTATPYSEDHAQGGAGSPKTLSFIVVREGPGLIVDKFVLVNSDTDTDLFELTEGITLNLSTLPSNLNVRIEAFGSVRSVHLTLEPQGISNIENVAPFALFGDWNGDYGSGVFASGKQELTAIAYSESGGQGKPGHPKSVSFFVTGASVGSNNGVAKSQQFTAGLPESLELAPAYPNPFNPTTTISFAVPESAHIQLVVYDMLGREVERLVDGLKEAGTYDVAFDAGHLPSGRYMYRLQTSGKAVTRHMLLVK